MGNRFSSPSSPSSSLLPFIGTSNQATEAIPPTRRRSSRLSLFKGKRGNNGGESAVSTAVQSHQPSQDVVANPLVMEEGSGTSQPIPVAFGKPFLLRWEDDEMSSSNRLSSSASPKNKSRRSSAKRQNSVFRRVSTLISSITTQTTNLAVPTNDEREMTSESTSIPSSKRFWCAQEESRECLMGEISQTSLLTFHGRNANAINVKGSSQPLVSVGNESVVTIYANVGNGRYLSSTSSPSTGERSLRFTASPQDIRANVAVAISCEFFVRRQQRLPSVQRTPQSSELKYGEIVTLESCSEPGLFLAFLPSTSASGGFQLVLSSTTASSFVMHSPTLRELVQLNATTSAQGSATSSSAAVSTMLTDFNDFELLESKQASERERQWMEEIAKRLPVDLAKRIFEFHFDWTRTARLCCKSWKAQAERSITRIRVNGEFCSLDSEEERTQLIDFVSRCPKLQVLTLRNVITLTDDDIARITENHNLLALVLGGCRRLSDKSTRRIAENLGQRLLHLNLAFTDITDESLRIVAENVRNLRELNLYNCSRVTVDGINRTVDLATGFTVLEHINLRGTVVDSHLVQEFRRKRPDVVVLTGPASADSIWG